MINQKKITVLTNVKIRFVWFSDVHILVKRYSTFTETDNAKWNKSIAFKNNAPFINYVSKINGVQINNAEDLDVVTTMYNLLE